MIWHLAHCELHIPPGQVEGMTMGEIEVCLDSPDPKRRRGPEGFREMGPGEIDALILRRRSMTMRQKIDQARRG